MNVSAPIPATIQIRRSRMLGLVGIVAALAAATTWAVLAFGLHTDGVKTRAGASAIAATGVAQIHPQQGSTVSMAGSLTPAERRSIGMYLFRTTSLSPEQLQAVRAYWFGSASSLTPAQFRSIRSYLFGPAGALVPTELQSVRAYYRVGASGSSALARRPG